MHTSTSTCDNMIGAHSCEKCGKPLDEGERVIEVVAGEYCAEYNDADAILYHYDCYEGEKP